MFGWGTNGSWALIGGNGTTETTKGLDLARALSATLKASLRAEAASQHETSAAVLFFVS